MSLLPHTTDTLSHPSSCYFWFYEIEYREEIGVVSIDMQAVRNFVEISGLVQKLKWGNSQHGDRFKVPYFVNESK